jgi:rhodanese-related sulfurtransferase
MHSPDPVQVVDIRPAAEFAKEHMDVAVNIPFAPDLGSKLQRFEPTRIILFYDADGRQSPSAIKLAQESGFQSVYGLSGGLARWKAAGQEHLTGSEAAAPAAEGDVILENYRTMTLDEFHRTMHSIPNVQLLDVRSEADYAKGYISGAVNFDAGGPAFLSQIQTLSKTKPLLVYGNSGDQASRAAAVLKENGFQVVYDLSTNFEDFKTTGCTLVMPQPEKPSGN